MDSRFKHHWHSDETPAGFGKSDMNDPRTFPAIVAAGIAFPLFQNTLLSGAAEVAPFRPLAGLCFFLLYRFGRRVWLPLYPAIIAGNLISGSPLPSAVTSPLAYVIGGGVALTLFDRFAGTRGLVRAKSIYSAFVLAPVAGALVGCVPAAWARFVTDTMTAREFLSLAAHRALADSLGTIVVFALLIAYDRMRWDFRRAAAVVATCALTVIGAGFAERFAEGGARTGMLAASIPVITGVFAAFVAGTAGAATVVFVAITAACLATAGGRGPLVGDGAPAVTGAYGMLLALLLLPIGAVIDILFSERERRARLLSSGRIALWILNRGGRLNFIGDAPDKTVIDGLKRTLGKPGKPAEFETDDGRIFALEHFAWESGREDTGLLRDITVERDVENERVRHAVTEARLRSLRSYLEPHALFNALAGLRGVIRTDSDAALDYVETFSRFLRLSLDAGMDKPHTLADELRLVSAYIDFRRFGGDADFGALPEPPPGTANLRVPPGSLQVLVENALKHGERDDDGRIAVSVDIHREDERLVIRVINPGHPGLDSGKPGGVRLIREQLAHLHPGDARAGLTLAARGHEVVAEITFPLSVR